MVQYAALLSTSEMVMGERKTQMWLECAATSNYPITDQLLGLHYFRDMKNTGEGIQLLEKAAQHGDSLAQLLLGDCFCNGDSVPFSRYFCFVLFGLQLSVCLWLLQVPLQGLSVT